jgi:hypothetical protein
MPRADSPPDLADLEAPKTDDPFWEREYRERVVGRRHLDTARPADRRMPCHPPHALDHEHLAGVVPRWQQHATADRRCGWDAIAENRVTAAPAARTAPLSSRSEIVICRGC